MIAPDSVEFPLSHEIEALIVEHYRDEDRADVRRMLLDMVANAGIVRSNVFGSTPCIWLRETFSGCGLLSTWPEETIAIS